MWRRHVGCDVVPLDLFDIVYRETIFFFFIIQWRLLFFHSDTLECLLYILCARPSHNNTVLLELWRVAKGMRENERVQLSCKMHTAEQLGSKGMLLALYNIRPSGGVLVGPLEILDTDCVHQPLSRRRIYWTEFETASLFRCAGCRLFLAGRGYCDSITSYTSNERTMNVDCRVFHVFFFFPWQNNCHPLFLSCVCVQNNKQQTHHSKRLAFSFGFDFYTTEEISVCVGRRENSRIYFVMYYPSIHRARERENGWDKKKFSSSLLRVGTHVCRHLRPIFLDLSSPPNVF